MLLFADNKENVDNSGEMRDLQPNPCYALVNDEGSGKVSTIFPQKKDLFPSYYYFSDIRS